MPLSLFFQPQAVAAQTPTTALLPVSPQPQRLLVLEQQLTSNRQTRSAEPLLNEYLDLALNEALQAGSRQLWLLQESWLTRVYATIRQAALNSQSCMSWRCLCFDYLYQPFFVLQEVYRQTPSRRHKLLTLLHEFRTLGRIFGS